MAKCKSCGAPVRWVTFPATGKHAPLDLVRTLNGSIALLDPAADKPQAYVVAKEHRPGTLFATHETLYVSHFATCPNAGQHRKPRT